jgi:hypothetical protein
VLTFQSGAGYVLVDVPLQQRQHVSYICELDRSSQQRQRHAAQPHAGPQLQRSFPPYLGARKVAAAAVLQQHEQAAVAGCAAAAIVAVV